VTTQGLKYLIIVMAVLVLMLVYLAQTSGGSLGSDPGFGLGAVLSSAVIVVVSWRWGGWRQSKMCGGSLP
jgi:hypothetical protein